MKNVFITLFLFCFVSIGAQTTLYPSEGDRFNYYLIKTQWGDKSWVWKTSPDNYDSPIILQSFISEDYGHYWIRNIKLKEKQFYRLKDYINTLPDILSGGLTYIVQDNRNILEAFDVVSNTKEIDLDALLNYLKKYFKDKK